MVLSYSAVSYSPNSQTCNLVIFCCVKSRNFEHAGKYYQQMMLDGIKPNDIILHDMLLMYCQQKSSRKVDKFFLSLFMLI